MRPRALQCQWSRRRWSHRCALIRCTVLPHSLSVCPYAWFVVRQIKVRDMSSVSVHLEPAEYSSWQEARTSLINEAKTKLKAKLEADLASTSDDMQVEKIRDAFLKSERDIEHNMDHEIHTFSAMLDLEYKCAFASIQILNLARPR